MSDVPHPQHTTRQVHVQTGRIRLVRAIAVIWLLAGVIAIANAEGGCELIIGSALPAYSCSPDATADTCPDEQVCDLTTGHCIAFCTPSSCGDWFCDLDHRCKPRLSVDASTSNEGAPPIDSGGLATDADATRMSDALDASIAAEGDTAGEADALGETGVPAADAFIVDSPPANDSQDAEGSAPDMGAPCAPGTVCRCSGSSDCANHVCVDRLAVGIPLINASQGAFCSKPCCTSIDCDDPSTVCYASALGGNYCVSAALLQRSTTTGAKLGGDPCTADSDCRSGLCSETTMLCADTCCSINNLSGCSPMAHGIMCSASIFPGVASFDQQYVANCGAFTGAPPGSSCNGPGDCMDGVCDGTPGVCHGLCRNAADCKNTSARCQYYGPALPRHYEASVPNPVVAACVVTQNGPKTAGQSCTSNTDCASNFCDSTVCTDLCFSDADCPPGWYCRPEALVSPAIGQAALLFCRQPDGGA